MRFCIGKLARVRELVRVAVGMIGPDVLDLIALPPALRVLDVAAGLPRPRFGVVGHASKEAMNLRPFILLLGRMPDAVTEEPFRAGSLEGRNLPRSRFPGTDGDWAVSVPMM